MEILVRKIHTDVEALRNQLIDTLDIQEAEVLGSIDRAYQQLYYANSIVTAHLSSIVKVHDAQADMLQTLGVDRDLRKIVGESLANASERIADVVEKAETASDKLANVKENAADLKKAIIELKQNLNTKGKEK
jgi:chemotaxis regulatin CheY-phosphate phosphatase CheZ